MNGATRLDKVGRDLQTGVMMIVTNVHAEALHLHAWLLQMYHHQQS